MATHVLMNVLDNQEMRVGVIRDKILESLIHERTTPDGQALGNIYKGRVANVEPSLDAAFIDLGTGKNGFLHVDDIRREYGGRSKRIEERLKPGQEITVQITKEAIRDKGPCLTTFLSVPGRCLVLVAEAEKDGGVSKRIEDPVERRRLKALMKTLRVPDGFGLIVRTAGAECSDDEIRLDDEYLCRLWQEISAREAQVKAPACLYQEGDVILRTLRDLVPSDVETVVIDQEDLYDEARAFCQVFMPEVAGKISLHREELPIFTYYGVEERLATVYDRKVPLPSGGNVVIEQTEALVSVDVNSSKNKEAADVATTALMTNLEAVGAIAEQLVLRDLGGLIVVDFIDMEDHDHQRLVQLALRKALLKDKAKTNVSTMSRFGLVELTRQRTRPSHRLISHGECPYCRGAGVVKTAETFEIDCMRALRESLAGGAHGRIEVVVPTDMAVAVLNSRRQEIARLEEEYDCRIAFVGDGLMKSREFRISTAGRKHVRNRKQADGGGPVRPSLLAPLLEQQAKAIAEARALAKMKPRDLEREIASTLEGVVERGRDEVREESPAPSVPAPAAAPDPVTIPAPTTVALPGIWSEIILLRELLFTPPRRTLVNGPSGGLARPEKPAMKAPPSGQAAFQRR